MECAKARTLMSEYIDGSADTQTTKALKAHLAECEKCKKTFFSLRTLVKELGSLEAAKAPENFLDRLHEEMVPKFEFGEFIRNLFFPPHVRLPFLTWQRRWFLILPFCLCMIAGMYISMATPKIYSVSTLILADPKTISDEYIQPITELLVRQRLTTITQEIKSPKYIKQVVKEAGLFSAPEYRQMRPHEKITEVRKNLSVSMTKFQGGTDSFRISLKGKYPEKITQAVNLLATYFIRESIRIMEEQVAEASHFFQEEIKEKEKQLTGFGNIIGEYRKKHLKSLPEQLGSNLNMLAGFRRQLNAKQESLKDEKIRQIRLEGQMEEIQWELENYVPETQPPEAVPDPRGNQQICQH